MILFAVLLCKKKKGSDHQANGTNDHQINSEMTDPNKIEYPIPNEKPGLYELQIPDSPGPPNKANKMIIVPKSSNKDKNDLPKKSMKDFSVQAVGLTNQSNQTDEMEDESIKDEIRILRGKIEALKNPSKIPRKNGAPNLFYYNSNSMQAQKQKSSVESIGTQSNSTSTSSIQTNDYMDSSTETAKLFVNSATDPMSVKKKKAHFQPENNAIFDHGNVHNSDSSLQTNVQKAEENTSLHSEPFSPSLTSVPISPSVSSMYNPESSNQNHILMSERSLTPNTLSTPPKSISPQLSDDFEQRSMRTSSPPPVIVSSPTPPPKNSMPVEADSFNGNHYNENRAKDLAEEEKQVAQEVKDFPNDFQEVSLEKQYAPSKTTEINFNEVEPKDKKEVNVEPLSLTPKFVPKATPSLTETSSKLDDDSLDVVDANNDVNQVQEVDDDKLEDVLISQNMKYIENLPKLDGAFKLCIDSVRMLPDNAVTYKISGKVLSLPKNKEGSFSVYCEDSWPFRSPRCTFEKVFNQETLTLSKDLTLSLKLYTVDTTTEKLSYIGYNLFDLVDQETGNLKGGGHKLNVYKGVPKSSTMKQKDLKINNIVPCIRICIRIIEKNKSFFPRPVHKVGFYKETQNTSKLEKKLFDHYFQIEDYDVKLKKHAKNFKWIQNSNDWVKNLYADALQASTFSFRLFNKHNLKDGVKVKIKSISGLPFSVEGTYLQCVAEVFGKKFRSKSLIAESYQKHPKWNDEATLFNAENVNSRNALIIKLYGVYCHDILKLNKNNYEISIEKGKNVKLLQDKSIAWTVCPVFVHNCVDAAVHVLPLFSGSPPSAFLKLMDSRGPSEVLIKFAMSKSLIKTLKTPAAIKVQLYDGLYDEDELFEQMTRPDERLLKAAGISERHHNVVEDGPKINQMLGEAFRDQNLSSPTNTQLKKAFGSLIKLMDREFDKLL